MFRAPLGQAREVKVALSGLFGRFVARAYLERYHGLSIFAHLGQREIRLDGRHRIRVKRKRVGGSGDLPDWVACDAGFGKLTVAEAKGCHDASGAQQALGRAWKQANRIDVITRDGRKAPVKRLAIATRWGLAGKSKPILSVRDPEEPGEMEPAEWEATVVGVTNFHGANLLRALGHVRLADALRRLVRAETARERNAATRRALGARSMTRASIKLRATHRCRRQTSYLAIG